MVDSTSVSTLSFSRRTFPILEKVHNSEEVGAFRNENYLSTVSAESNRKLKIISILAIALQGKISEKPKVFNLALTLSKSIDIVVAESQSHYESLLILTVHSP